MNKRAEVRWKYGSEIQGAIRASYIALTGCGVILTLALIAILRDRPDEKMNSAEAFAAISGLHGLTWPTNAETAGFVLWRYPAERDGNVRITETLAKLTTDDESFSSWYSSATNVLSEQRQTSVPYDARLSEKANWWAPHELGDGNVDSLSHEMSQPTGVSSKLSLFIGATETSRVIYVHCQVRQP